jgi:hypothetical protein
VSARGTILAFKEIDEFDKFSFEKFCWGFAGPKPLVSYKMSVAQVNTDGWISI